MKEPRILVISHNAFSTTGNMGKTLASLFFAFNKNNLAQLYFHSSKLDTDCCDRWFEITDFDVLKSIFSRRECGRVASIGTTAEEDNSNVAKNVYKYGSGHTPMKLLMRDLVWRIGNWHTKALMDWIKDFNPTHIFFASGYSMFAFDVALTISKEFHIPLITYFCDDYYNEEIKTLSPIYWLRRNLFKHKVEKTVSKSSELVYISHSMELVYEQIFGKQGQTIRTPYTTSINKIKPAQKPIVLSFMGNMALGRWKVLVKIAEAVSRINRNEKKIIFEVYSGGTPNYIIDALNVNGENFYKGTLSPEEVVEKMKQSDVLLHVESFERKNIEKTRHSISTKIADSLASSRVILAVGPRGIASIDYLEENHAAYIIDDEKMIENKLIEYFINHEIDIQIIQNAKKLAETNHNISKNSHQLQKIFETI